MTKIPTWKIENGKFLITSKMNVHTHQMTDIFLTQYRPFLCGKCRIKPGFIGS